MSDVEYPRQSAFHQLPELLIRRTGRNVTSASLTLLTIILALALTIGATAEDDTSTETPVETDEDSQTSPVCDMAPVLLKFNTYERGWIRYLNVDDLGELLLSAVDDKSDYPFRRFNNGRARVRIGDLQDLEFLHALASDHDLTYDEDLVDGVCDVTGLRGYNSSNVLCKPGTEGMEDGHVFLVLYHPLTFNVAALTTSIDNTSGGALRDWSLPDRSATTAGDEQYRPCGPFNEGQWIKVQSLDPDHGLPVSMKDVLWEVTDYQCVIADDGQPYLQAYSIRHDLSGESGSGCWCQDFLWRGLPCPYPQGCCASSYYYWNACDGPHAISIERYDHSEESFYELLDSMTPEARRRLTIHG